MDFVCNLLGHRLTPKIAAEVRCPRAGIDDALYGGFDSVRFIEQAQTVAKQQRRRENGADRVADVAAGDVGRGPVHWFEQAWPFAAKRSRRSKPDRAA